jgi:hypothetical protein
MSSYSPRVRGTWWTRTQRILTTAELPFDAELFNTDAQPLYQRIASEALQLSHLGLGFSAISIKLSVDVKTVAKGVAWLRAQA